MRREEKDAYSAWLLGEVLLLGLLGAALALFVTSLETTFFDRYRETFTS